MCNVTLTLNLLPTLTRTSFLACEPVGVAAAASGNSFLMKESRLTATSCSRLAWRASLFFSRKASWWTGKEGGGREGVMEGESEGGRERVREGGREGVMENTLTVFQLTV